jgi:hypothetical protein
MNTIHTSCLPRDQGDENDVEREKNQLYVTSALVALSGLTDRSGELWYRRRWNPVFALLT